jgi:FkbM family methyltransferase
MSVTVAIATYGRADALARCLEGLARQRRPPDEVLVAHRHDDLATRELLRAPCFASLPMRPVSTPEPGLVAARNAALRVARGDIVAFVDDDAVPRDDWTARIDSAFSSDPQLSAFGGRDLIASSQLPLKEVVGKLQWFGRPVGNHHVGTGRPRDVDFLKGCNMSYRRAAVEAIRFDERLRGSGAQVCEDMAFCLTLKRAGGKLRYDPALTVEHHPAAAVDDHRTLTPENLTDAVHNETLTIFEHLRPIPRIFFMAWAFLIGTRGSPGLLSVPRLVGRHRNWLSLLIASLDGRLLAVRTALRTGSRGSRSSSHAPPPSITVLRKLGRNRFARRAVLPAVRVVVGRGRVVAGPGKGLRLHLRGSNPGYLVGGSEPDVQRMVARLGPGDVLYDVGANIGFFSLIAARNGATAIAFEPSPTAATLLRRNARANQLDIQLFTVAIGEAPGHALLSADQHLTARIGHHGTPVRVVRLDDVDDIPPPTLVKIDVEGFETHVLRGMTRILRTHNPLIICEIHDRNLSGCMDILKELGYQSELHSNGGMPHLIARSVNS